jgi:L-asparaginase / beta-aspartyl-peptidase
LARDGSAAVRGASGGGAPRPAAEARVSLTGAWAGQGGRFSLLVHGGAGDVPEERRRPHADGCRLAAEAGAELLRGGGSALDAVVRAVAVLEDDPRYNAGTGASLTSSGHIELDAAVMEGARLGAGAVCALGPFKNPVAIARAVLERGAHVLYAGAGADGFAQAAGFAPLDEASMITAAARVKLAAALAAGEAKSWAGGTVGAVARDTAGHVAAATSTGGMAGQLPGRVGDSPIVGAGTYADDLGGAASATGEGEGILRVALTAGIVGALRGGILPEQAAREAMSRLASRVGASGGVIVVDRDGHLGWARTTATMSWAAAWDGAPTEWGW